MNISKTFVLGVVTITAVGVVGVAGFLGVKAFAATAGSGTYPTIIANLAKAFGVDESKVAQVFTDTKTQQETARLDAAVTAKEITSAQKDLILAKEKETTAAITAIDTKQLTAAERQTELQKVRTALEAWATTNNIPLRFVMFGGRGGMMGGEFGGGKGGMGGGMMNRGLL